MVSLIILRVVFTVSSLRPLVPAGMPAGGPGLIGASRDLKR
jgi:hypothetical protein